MVRVLTGTLELVFDDDGRILPLGPDAAGVIAPERIHHLVLNGPVELEIDFYSAT